MILPMVLQDSLILPKGPTKCLVGFFLLWKEFDLCFIPAWPANGAQMGQWCQCTL
jgi:hypothetical protein